LPTRQSAYARLLDHFHTHPRGRFHEFLFFAAIALVIGGADFWAWRADQLNDPIALLIAIVAACFFGFGLLPQKKPKSPPDKPLPGKRGEIQARVKASKAEKRKGPPPPIG